MGHALRTHFSHARAVFDEVSAALEFDVAKMCDESTEEELRATQNAQVALFTCGVAAHRCLPVGEILAGHSVGEYAAIAASGQISVAEGARLVRLRGELMANAGSDRAGTMAAVLGLGRDELAAVCKEASSESELVVIANDNCPGQLVISGDVVAVGRASTLASEAGAKRVLPLNVSGAFHSPLMAEAARQMGERLHVTEFSAGKPVVANVTAELNPNPADWQCLLEEQLLNPVRWTETVQLLLAQGVTTFVEFGVGEVLGGLVRRVSKEVTTAAVFDLESLEKAKSVC
jgi:[acyl-carrier-protein] S-malonyltransferase